MSDRLRKVKEFVFGPSVADEEDDFSSEYNENLEEDTSIVEYSATPKRAQEPPATVTSLDQRRRMASVQAQPLSEIAHVRPRSFAEAAGIGESFRDGVPVILNMTVTDETQAQKLIDFCSGMAFVTGGTLERITSRVFLLTPKSVKLTEADKAELTGQQYLHS